MHAWLHSTPVHPQLQGIARFPSCLQVSKPDWLVWMVVFLGCLFVGIDWGLLFGVGLSIIIQLGYISFPQLQVLSHLPGSAVLRSADTSALSPQHSAVFNKL